MKLSSWVPGSFSRERNFAGAAALGSFNFIRTGFKAANENSISSAVCDCKLFLKQGSQVFCVLYGFTIVSCRENGAIRELHVLWIVERATFFVFPGTASVLKNDISYDWSILSSAS